MLLSVLLSVLLLLVNPIYTDPETEGDTLREVHIEEVTVVSSVKDNETLRHQPSSVSIVGAQRLGALHTTSLKGVSALVPNFFMPDYGSRLTSAIYIRGIGSRIGTPAVGMYVDNVPYYDKTSFDLSLYDVQQIEVLRGPQSTVYGRNTMGGLIRVHTKSPFSYDGTDIGLGYATKDNHRRATLTHYHRLSDKFAFSIGGFYDGGDGFFSKTLPSGETSKVDDNSSAGGRLRAIYRPAHNVSLDMNVGYEYSDEGAYPYYYVGSVTSSESYPDLTGKISANLDGCYRRSMWNAGANAEVRASRFIFNSVTAYQNITDRMFMDQDFISADIYSLSQRQRINTLSEELTMKSLEGSRWQWVQGASISYQWTNTKGPVTFRKDGVDWLNSVINTNANAHIPLIQNGPMTMKLALDDKINGDNLLFDNNFDTPTMGLAIFHQSTYNDMFGVRGLSFTAGLRLDYEKMWMKYDAWYDFAHTYALTGNLTTMGTERVISMVPAQDFAVSRSLPGRLSNDYLQLLPRVAVKYEFPAIGNVYATVSRGYRSGGYNIQNISELMRPLMTADMMRGVADATIPVLKDQKAVPDDTKDYIIKLLNSMAQSGEVDVEKSCLYKPEYAWNFEVGTHLDLMPARLSVDMSTYLSMVRNLQLSQMSETGLGRVTVNAGRSRAIGLETTIKAMPVANLNILASYGYTYATLRKYSDYDAEGNLVDCRGNYVPFMPKHTFNVDAAYTFNINNRHSDALALQALTIGADYSGVGRIYWTETYDVSQKFYSQLGARLTMRFPSFDINLWGRNITDTKFDTFYFESSSRGYAQHGRPLQMGVDIRYRL